MNKADQPTLMSKAEKNSWIFRWLKTIEICIGLLKNTSAILIPAGSAGFGHQASPTSCILIFEPPKKFGGGWGWPGGGGWNTAKYVSKQDMI